MVLEPLLGSSCRLLTITFAPTLSHPESECNGRDRDSLWRREPDAVAAGVRPPEDGDPRGAAGARSRADRGRAGRTTRRQPRALTGGDRPFGGGGSRHGESPPGSSSPLALEGRVPRALPGARGARADGRAARCSTADR